MRSRTDSFLTHKVKLIGYEGRHVVEHVLELLKMAGMKVTRWNLEVYPSPQDKIWVKNVLDLNHLRSGELLVAVIPGGGASWGKDASVKRWPAQNYSRLADKIIENFSAKVILLGDSNEQGLVQEFKNVMRHSFVDLIGKSIVLNSV